MSPAALYAGVREGFRAARSIEEGRMTLADLSPRRRQVIELIAEGYDYMQIAARMGITERTVKNTVRQTREIVGSFGNVIELLRQFYTFTPKEKHGQS